ncbi:MAG: FAD-dependent monooxygenase [Myxococcota bacterium]|nr:FAD-dependent monooxygenase [Myxococcota bacterium]
MTAPAWLERGVLIVGGGIAGLTLAGALQRMGVECQLAERSETWAPVGAGIILGVNAMAIMRRFDLADGLEERAWALEGMTITDAKNRHLIRTNLAELRPRFGISLALHRAVLHEALLSAARGVPIRMGTTVDSLEETDECVRAHFSDGSEASFALVVGADGLHSQVRSLVFGDVPLRYSGYTCWRMVVESDEMEVSAQEMWGRGQRFGAVHIDAKRVYCFAVVNAEAGRPDPAAGRVQRLREEFSEFAGPVPALLASLEAPEQLIQNDLYEVLHTPWYRGRVVLVGDAAHGMTPDMGQGAAMALEDIAVLTESLGLTDSPAEALGAWAARRTARVRWIQNQSRRIGQVGQWESRLACGLRNQLTRATPAWAATRALKALAGQRI